MKRSASEPGLTLPNPDLRGETVNVCLYLLIHNDEKRLDEL